MTTIAARRWRNALLTIAAAAAILFADAVTSASLRQSAFLTGWFLLAIVITLVLFNARKKLPFLPLGRAAVWLRYHIYVGLLSIAVFAAHIDLRVPDGAVEVALAFLFLVVALSGVVGLLISRGISRRLTRRGEEVIFERIPLFRRELRDEAEDLVRRSVADSDSTTIADFYAARLRHLFDGPRDYLQHLFEMNISRYAIETELLSVGRYLSDKELEILDELAHVVRRNDELNYHHALQFTLKAWLFVHVPLTYSMLVTVAVHVTLVYAFSEGLS